MVEEIGFMGPDILAEGASSQRLPTPPETTRRAIHNKQPTPQSMATEIMLYESTEKDYEKSFEVV
jgi:hypothetical protein